MPRTKWLGVAAFMVFATTGFLLEYYLDGIHYDLRPTVWVEPLEGWGKGVVQLVEIPTDDEIHDNICAYWLAEKPTRSGDTLRFRYRLHWLEAEPGFPVDVLARAVGYADRPGWSVRKASSPWHDQALRRISG